MRPSDLPLGIVADEISRDFAEAVRIGLPLGLRRYEVRFLKSGRAPMCDAAELREVERIAAGEGLEITALSPGLFKYTETAGAFQREMDEIYPRAAEWAHRWKLAGLIVFGFHKPGATEANAASLPREPVPRQVLDWMAAAGERAAADGLVLMVEPEPICRADTGRAAAAMMGPGLGINYDPGNVAWFLGSDPIAEFDAVAPWIANVHIKDVRLPGPRWVPAGEGIIDYRLHFAALQRAAVGKAISLEPHMDGSPETIRRCLDAFERLWEKAGGAARG
ncbi:MAG TPA: sugar phosphate isomerase/epimerase [Bryobacteraceae bacterium]|nr:sugar phosphate isomerase/epimerase [Bryobacteraceae bacterium]